MVFCVKNTSADAANTVITEAAVAVLLKHLSNFW